MCPSEPQHTANRTDSDSKDDQKSLNRRLLEHRTVVISGGVTDRLAQRVISSLLALDAEKEEPIYVYVNSPGGDAFSGLAIYDTLQFVKSPVTTVATGLIASAGTLIYVAPPKERRLAMRNARVMIHQPSTGVRGQASDIEIEAREIIAFRERLNRIMSEQCGQPLDKVERDVMRNYWMSAEAAQEYGVVGRIISHKGEIG